MLTYTELAVLCQVVLFNSDFLAHELFCVPPPPPPPLLFMRVALSTWLRVTVMGKRLTEVCASMWRVWCTWLECKKPLIPCAAAQQSLETARHGPDH